MSNTKTVMGQASNQYVVPTDITDVFSTYLYTGTGAAHTITNGIDLDGEGGLVWIKDRDSSDNHALFDTERGAGVLLQSSVNLGQYSGGTDLSSFNSNGFTLGSTSFIALNTSGTNYASWSFKKQTKFFDIVTYTGDGVAGREISHSLGSAPGSIFVKRTNDTGHWYVYHRSTGSTGHLVLNLTDSFTTFSGGWNDTNPTDTEFTLGNSGYVNASGDTYVAYLFAHNDGDGGFGPSGDQDIIKCGSFTTDGSGLATVDLGFEPQFLIRRMLSGGNTWNRNWDMYDIMRGITTNNDYGLEANTSDAEVSVGNQQNLTPTGFTVHESTVNQTFIYIAIRRGPLAPPESATEVFAIDGSTRSSDGSSPRHRADFPVDMALYKDKSGGAGYLSDRLRQNWLVADSTSAEFSSVAFDFQNGWIDSSTVVPSNISWMWKRAPGFCDVVAYTGNSTAGRTVSHNLGVAPEMMWVKRRDASGYDWNVYVSGQSNVGYLNSSNGFIYSQIVTATADSSFTLNNDIQGNASGGDYIAYLFASLDGISKVGSYTGDGTTDGSKVIDCGFTSGARFVLIKTSNTAGDWMVYDTVRGIVVGNDPLLSLNDTFAEATTYDNLIPNSSGFAVIQNTDGAYTTNESNHEYIFYAIA